MPRRSSGVDSVILAMRVLEYVIRSAPSGVGVREVSRALSLATSTVNRLMNSLQESGMLRREKDGGPYFLGMEFQRLAWIATSRYPVRELALPVMQRLTSQTDETSLLAVYNPQLQQVAFVASVECSQPIRYEATLNEWQPVHAGASGLAVLAFLPEAERKAIYEAGPLAAVTPQTLTDPSALEAEVAAVRERAYAASTGQRIPGATAVAAPVRGASGRVVGALMLTIPVYRFDPDKTGLLASLIIAHANELSALLGYVPPAAVPGSLARPPAR